MRKIVAIIQVRMDSTRFPKKALAEILGQPMTIRLLERVKKSRLINEIVVATTTRSIDDPLAEVVREYGISIFRGSYQDVLDRYYQTAKNFHADIIVRITGDCPLIDPIIVDLVIQLFLDNEYDYVNNTLVPTYPDGLDVEVFSFKTLEETWKEATLLSEREHVTPYIKKHPEKFRIGHIGNEVDLSHLRWTVDREKDLEFVREIFKRLYNKKPFFLMDDIVQLLRKHPELKEINLGIWRNESYLKSLQKDKIFLKKNKKGINNKKR